MTAAATTPEAGVNHTRYRFVKWGMLPLRIAVGLVFLMHGGQKFFVFGLSGTADIMAKLGIPLPTLAAAVVITVELLGGLAILLGVFARLAGAYSHLRWSLRYSLRVCVAASSRHTATNSSSRFSPRVLRSPRLDRGEYRSKNYGVGLRRVEGSSD